MVVESRVRALVLHSSKPYVEIVTVEQISIPVEVIKVADAVFLPIPLTTAVIYEPSGDPIVGNKDIKVGCKV